MQEKHQELTLILPNETATRELGMKLGQFLPAGTVLLLGGDLGSGKTTLVQGIGLGLGLLDPVNSPTFVLVNEYTGGRLPLYHFDLYRLQAAEVDALHLEDYWLGEEVALGLVAIEWFDRLTHLPAAYIGLQLIPTPEGGRQACLTNVNSMEGLSEIIARR